MELAQIWPGMPYPVLNGAPGDCASIGHGVTFKSLPHIAVGGSATWVRLSLRDRSKPFWESNDPWLSSAPTP